MEVSAQSLARLAAERQFQPATLERVIRLLDILDAFAADRLIAPRIALKGGTALNFFHTTLDRLSVDIDINHVGEAEKARMDEDRPILEERLLRLLESKGYSAHREPSEHAGGKWIFRRRGDGPARRRGGSYPAPPGFPCFHDRRMTETIACVGRTHMDRGLAYNEAAVPPSGMAGSVALFVRRAAGGSRMRLPKSFVGNMLLASVLATAPLSGPAAEPELLPEVEVSAEMLIEAARAALAKGEPEDAAVLLNSVKPGEGNADDLDFLHGSIAMQRGDWQAAIARFRAMLARNPDLPRVRLDLALAYFQAEEDDNAARHFNLALGTKDLPETVRARVLDFLDRIRRRKRWSVTGSLALAPDNNINSGTDARTVDLLGNPATLSEDSRRNSGVGVTANLSGGYEGRISPDLRFRVRGGLRTRTYRESEFNQRTVTLGAGPRFLFDRFDLRPELTAWRQWDGGDAHSRALGMELSGNWLIGPTWRLGASLGRERVDYESYLGGTDSNIDSVWLDLAHVPGKATLLQVDTGWRRETLDRDAYSWREFVVGASVSRELPLGFVVRGGTTWRSRKYGAPLPLFSSEARRDRTLAARITLSNRNVELFGFMPEITLGRERRKSTLALWDYTRTVGEIGIVRTF